MKDVKGADAVGARGIDRFSNAGSQVSGARTDGRGAYGGFEPVEVTPSDWDSFTYQPTASAAPRISVDPVEHRSPSMASGGLPRGIRGTGDADRQIDEAILGLSQPARPRNTNPAETQSFAPARDAEFELEPRQSITLDDFDELISSELAAMRGTHSAPAQHHDEDDYALGYDDTDGEVEHYDDYPVRTRSRLGGVMLMGSVAVVAIVAVAGAAFVLMPAGSQGDGSMLIKADAEPYKVAPADPGGRSIPNQNKAVYQKVAGDSSQAAPAQESLVTAMEEPLEIVEEQDMPVDTLPGVEVGDQIALPGEEQPEAPAPAVETASNDGTLQPRKVRTLTVRPDGTLVASETVAPAGETGLLTASSMQTQAGALDPIAGIQPAMPFSEDEPDLTTASTVASPAAEAPQPIPQVVPPAPPTTEPAQVAALEPVAQPEPTDAFFVQVASQPSQGAAEESMANLGRRYASVIGGRSMGIKSAEIPGKGTYYRVRVAAATRSEANSLCESLKSAGGSCFVTR